MKALKPDPLWIWVRAFFFRVTVFVICPKRFPRSRVVDGKELILKWSRSELRCQAGQGCGREGAEVRGEITVEIHSEKASKLSSTSLWPCVYNLSGGRVDTYIKHKEADGKLERISLSSVLLKHFLGPTLISSNICLSHGYKPSGAMSFPGKLSQWSQSWL